MKSVPRPSVSQCVSNFNDERRAPWLLSAYSDPVWTVASTGSLKGKATIDFRYILADGRLLIDAERLCATVKEYAWWIRDPRYSRIDDARTHARMVGHLIGLAHALTIRKLNSFEQLQPYDLEGLIEDCCFGVDTILCAAERVETYLQGLQDENNVAPKPFGGLPRFVYFTTGTQSKMVHSEKIMEACHLPESASRLPRIAALVNQAATRYGLKTSSERHDENIPSLSTKTVQTITCWLKPLEQLYVMRRRIKAEGIAFKPFPYGAACVAAVKGVAVERTPTPPPLLTLHLLEHSARWIFRYDLTVTDAPMDRRTVIRTTSACWIIIAAFTARRASEINDLREGCLRGDNISGWWLHVYIEKTLQRKEWIPVPVLVAKAIERMLTISAEARLETKSDQLFQWRSPDGLVSRLDVTRCLDEFAAVVKTPPHRPRGELAAAWHWTPHQFRRFFAVLYFYRFDGATIEVLSHHLRHFSLEMTKRYITKDPEVASLWTDVEWGYAGHVARSIVAGERAVSGSAGERLKRTGRRLMDVFRRKLWVTSPERLGAHLKLVMQRQGMVLTPKPWVTCSCPRTHDAAAKASCQRQSTADIKAVGPDFVYASPMVCSSCPHAIIEGNRTFFVNDEVIHLEAAVTSGTRADTVFGELEGARLIGLSELQITKYEGATPLIPPTAPSEEEA